MLAGDATGRTGKALRGENAQALNFVRVTHSTVILAGAGSGRGEVNFGAFVVADPGAPGLTPCFLASLRCQLHWRDLRCVERKHFVC